MTSIGPGNYALLSGLVVAIGVLGLAVRRDALGMVCSLGLLLLAPVIGFAGAAETGAGAGSPPQGEVAATASLVLAIAVVLVGAALAAVHGRRRASLDLDVDTELDA